MAEIDEIKEDISFNSRLLTITLATIVVTTGGIAGLFLSIGERELLTFASPVVLFLAGPVAIVVLSGVSLGLYLRCRRLIRRLGEFK